MMGTGHLRNQTNLVLSLYRKGCRTIVHFMQDSNTFSMTRDQ